MWERDIHSHSKSNCQAVEGICQDAPMELKLQPLTGERLEGSTDLNIDEASSGDVADIQIDNY